MSGRVVIHKGDKAKLDRVVSRIALLSPDKAWLIEVKQYVKKRSVEQNALYHKWVDILAQHHGYDHEDMADVLKRAYIPASGRRVVTDLQGDEYEKHSTTWLNTKEMSEYLDAIDRHAASEGVMLPHPEELNR